MHFLKCSSTSHGLKVFKRLSGVTAGGRKFSAKSLLKFRKNRAIKVGCIVLEFRQLLESSV